LSISQRRQRKEKRHDRPKELKRPRHQGRTVPSHRIDSIRRLGRLTRHFADARGEYMLKSHL
jgi:hypothetical protein